MIDLHSHTDQSDGTASPAELVEMAAKMGLEALGITDHDTLEGYDLAAPAAAGAGLELVCGIELSTRPERKPGRPLPASVHLLGYFLDGPVPEDFRAWLLRLQESRNNRNLALEAKLRSLGMDISLDEVQKLGRNLTGRPHFARMMLDKGYVRTRQEAFDLYLADNARAAVEREEPTVIEGVRRIRAAGGLPSIAHPVRLPQGGREGMEAFLPPLVEAGLPAIEVYHSEHGPADVALYLDLARRYGLIATGGSDFHGENKPGISLGTGTAGNLDLPYRLLDEMREGAARLSTPAP